MCRESQTCDKLAETLVWCGVAASAAAGAPLPPGFGETLSTAGSLRSVLRRHRNASADAIVKRFGKELKAEWRNWAETAHRDPGAMESAALSFEEVLPHLNILPTEIVGGRLSPEQLAREGPRQSGRYYARRLRRRRPEKHGRSAGARLPDEGDRERLPISLRPARLYREAGAPTLDLTLRRCR